MLPEDHSKAHASCMEMPTAVGLPLTTSGVTGSAPAARSEALALSLGSSHLGFCAHAGFLEALQNHGIHPGQIGAASSGAFVGGLFAHGFSPAKIRDLTSCREMRRAFWEWMGPLRGMGMLLNLSGFTGLLSGRKVVTFLKRHVGDAKIEDCPVAELSLAVTNLNRGESQIVRSGSLAEYIVASCAVPGLFQGYRIGNNHFWDGAVSDSSPLHHFSSDSRIRSILVHIVDNAPHFIQPPLTVRRAFGQAHQIISDRMADLSGECCRAKGKQTLFLRTSAARFRFLQKGTGDVLFKLGYETAISNLDRIRALTACPNSHP